MTNLLIFLLAIFLSLSFYFFIAYFLKLPTFKAEKALLMSKRTKKGNIVSIDAICYSIALKLSPLFQKLDTFFLDKLQANLVAADIEQKASLFIANVFVQAFVSAVICIPLIFISPVFIIVMVLIVILVFRKEITKPNKMITKKREAIESELPRFAATISQELRDNRDILRMIESFSKSAGELTKHELLITAADMKTGNYEIALLRFERRINSAMLSDIIRGLIAVLRGDDGRAFFEMLCVDMKQQEISKLKKLALKRPPKINACSMILLFTILAIFMGVLFTEIIDNAGTLF